MKTRIASVLAVLACSASVATLSACSHSKPSSAGAGTATSVGAPAGTALPDVSQTSAMAPAPSGSAVSGGPSTASAGSPNSDIELSSIDQLLAGLDSEIDQPSGSASDGG